MPFDPNFLLQAMLATGSGLNPDPWVQNLSGLGSDTLKSENMWKAIMGGGSGAGAGGKNKTLSDLIKAIMGGGITDSKLTLDDGGAKIDMAPKMVSEYFGGGSGKMGEGFKGTPAEFGNFIPETFSLGQDPEVTAPEPSKNLPTGPGVMDILKTFMSGGENPSVSQPGTAMPNLAGLTPKDIARAFGARTNIERLKQSREALPSDIGYKKALTQHALLPAKKMNLPDDKRTAAIKNYEYAVEGGYKKPFDEFVAPGGKEATSIQEWKQAVAGGYTEPYHVWKKEMTALGGGLSLEEKVKTKVAMSAVKRREILADPLKIKKAVNEAIEKDYSLKAKLLTDDPTAQADKAKIKMEIIRSTIEDGAGSGKIIESSREGSIITIKVKWPSGDTEEMRYDLAK